MQIPYTRPFGGPVYKHKPGELIHAHSIHHLFLEGPRELAPQGSRWLR